MLDAGRHPLIEILTCSELVALHGDFPRFVATVRKNPRFVREDLCTGCGDCEKVCPVVAPNPFDAGLKARKAIYRPFAQAVPSSYLIDRETCLNKEFLACGHCMKACQRKAVDFDMAPQDRKLRVGSVVIASGFDPFDASLLGR
ncbi:MAG: CoB--CoM heterodisulfide reductase iron-sulfur subunit A family protein, partial [Armatimonadetes bacterium]|nr:CoB--CoM heterodisulfide reductase iron-sulfur subunit A family protein [Armatimonadota bacterium]